LSQQLKGCMKTSQVTQVRELLNESKTWQSLNADTMNMPRWEGVMPESKFNRQLVKCLHPYEGDLRSIRSQLACGFEIEFYLEPNKMAELEQALMNVLPESQMLLMDIKQVVPTNGRHFYLMAENTGEPPEGFKSYELVSPILDPKSLPYFVTKFSDILQALGAEDNDSVGFHLHVSTLEKTPISPLALIYFLDDKGCFDWPNRQFTRDIVGQFFRYQPQDWQVLFETVTRKCYNLNLLRYSDHNRFELRSVGGQGYLRQAANMLETSLLALQACDEAKHTPLDDVAKKVLENYPLNKKVEPLHRLTSDALHDEAAMKNQLWLATIVASEFEK